MGFQGFHREDGVNGALGTLESDMSIPLPPPVVLWGVCRFTSPCKSALVAIPLSRFHCSSQEG